MDLRFMEPGVGAGPLLKLKQEALSTVEPSLQPPLPAPSWEKPSVMSLYWPDSCFLFWRRIEPRALYM